MSFPPTVALVWPRDVPSLLPVRLTSRACLLAVQVSELNFFKLIMYICFPKFLLECNVTRFVWPHGIFTDNSDTISTQLSLDGC